MRYLHTMVRVRDLEASLKFYCDLLGLEEVSRSESPQGRFTLVFLCAPGDRDLARERRAPTVELTYNWDPEDYIHMSSNVRAGLVPISVVTKAKDL